MRTFAALVATLLLTGTLPALGASHKTISLRDVSHFSDLADARRACGKDPVVWANLRTEVYHLPGSRWFGKTKRGAYFCEAALDKKGVRRSKE
ncbi:MAG: hypothetical protein ACRESR_10375 [Gammaproteobacteria bacterium]